MSRQAWLTLAVVAGTVVLLVRGTVQRVSHRGTETTEKGESFSESLCLCVRLQQCFL